MATSHCNGILETTRHNRHNGLLPAPACYGLVTGETGVTDFGLSTISADDSKYELVARLGLCPWFSTECNTF